MGVISSGAFRAAIGNLDRERLAAFVADIWEQQGWETDVEGGKVVARRGEDRRTIRVVAAGDASLLNRPRPPLEDPDVVVDASGEADVAASARQVGATYRPPDDIRDRLLYGVPREVGDRLFRQYCGRSLIEGDSRGDRLPVGVGTSGLVAALVAVLVIAAVVGSVPAPVRNQVGIPSEHDGGVARTDRNWTTPEVTATPEATATPRSYPAGISASGVTNVSKLAGGHVESTKNRQYALNVTFTGPAVATGFENWTRVRWSLRLESPRHYLINATYRRAGSKPTEVRRGVYVDSVILYRRTSTANATRYTALPAGASDGRAFVYVASAMIARYLDTTDSNLTVERVDGDIRYRIVATGVPARLNESVTDYVASALVTPDGRVTALTVRYKISRDGRPRKVRVSFEYSDYRDTRVTPPGWIDEARNRTRG